MKPSIRTIAYIDGANLYNGVKDQGWQLDYLRFRKWLSDKFHVTEVKLFIGLDPKQSSLYQQLQQYGYVLVFKPTVTNLEGKIKGNCDADMVLQIVADAYDKISDSAIVVTSDGDFYSTVQFLQQKQHLSRIISPSPKCSILLKRTGAPITYIHEIKTHVQKKKSPMKTVHHKGLSRSDILR